MSARNIAEVGIQALEAWDHVAICWIFRAWSAIMPVTLLLQDMEPHDQ